MGTGLTAGPQVWLDRKQKRGAGMAVLSWVWDEIKLFTDRQGGSCAQAEQLKWPDPFPS